MDPAGGSFRIHTLNIARALSPRYEVLIVSDFIAPFSALERGAFPAEARVEQIDRKTFFDRAVPDDTFLLYQMGNNQYYSWIMEEFLRAPGAVVVHDPSMYWPLSGNKSLCENFLDEELGLITGFRARAMLDWDRRPRAAGIMAHGALYNRAILQYATEIFCHSESTTAEFRAKFPGVPCHAITLTANFLEPVAPVAADERPEGRRIMFSLLGYQSEYKRVRDVLRAFAILSRTRSDFQLRCVGRWEGALREHCKPDIALLTKAGLLTEDNRYVSETELSAEITKSDVVINLRYPTAGESSGIACQTLTLGRPLLVNRYAAFQDLPTEATYQIPFAAEGDEAEHLAARIAEILDDRATLAEKTRAAARFGAGTGIEAYSAQYLAAFASCADGHVARRRRQRTRLRVRGVNDGWKRLIEPADRAELGRMLWLNRDMAMQAAAEGVHLNYNAQRVMAQLLDGQETPAAFAARLAVLRKFVAIEPCARERGALLDVARQAAWISWSGDADDMVEDLELFMDLVRAAPIGCCFIVPEQFSELMTLTFGVSSEAGMRRALVQTFAEEALKQKYLSEVSLFRIGLHQSGEFDTAAFGRQHVLRKGSNVIERDYGMLPEAVDRSLSAPLSFMPEAATVAAAASAVVQVKAAKPRRPLPRSGR